MLGENLVPYRTTVVSCVIAGFLLTACDEAPEAAAPPGSTAAPSSSAAAASSSAAAAAPSTVEVDGQSVAVSCSGEPVDGRPVVLLLSGLGDDLTMLADLQGTLGESGRACSYDRLGQGASDQPSDKQTMEDAGTVLTSVIDEVAGDGPVVLAGHSLGGLIAARYAPDHQDRVAGLVLLDATTPTTVADATSTIPESATGVGAQIRAETIGVYGGENPERLVIADGPVRPAGDIPVEVIQHGQQYLAEVPEYGPELERAWAAGQRAWVAVSTRGNLSIATDSAHHIYKDQPELVVRAVQRVVTEAVD
ncbi:alpha/beta hydrolase [Actinophytocola xinjiangensis]|uniref:Alpha/beta hydrolase n=1 Tax=Actinophytocola xinjiangensis TaxID=485602 RepID=A0A7Z0WFC6_9PSEU|nr:alpha/beta hydrolase [Actinophytocola xinjiangensis]